MHDTYSSISSPTYLSKNDLGVNPSLMWYLPSLSTYSNENLVGRKWNKRNL